MWFTILLSIAIVLCWCHYYVRCRRMGKYINKLPGPKAWPIVGNILVLMVPYEQLWRVLRKMSKDYYPIYKIWSHTQAVVNICHPDDIED